MLDRVKAFFRRSVTIAWARFLVLAGSVLELAAQAADVLQAVAPQLLPMLPPTWVGAYTLAIGLITELARRRTLAKAA